MGTGIPRLVHGRVELDLPLKLSRKAISVLKRRAGANADPVVALRGRRSWAKRGDSRG